ncbi:MAG: hypothetical protein Q4C64_02100 [Erysipelotrichia bacterium]|nr:hypothetical protein [Erysipelotrichia bacterium]
MKKILIILLSVMLLLLTFGCQKEDDVLKYTQSGLTVELPEGMISGDENGFDIFLYNNDFMFSALKENYDIFNRIGYDPEKLTVEEYGKLIMEINNDDDQFEEDAFNNLYISYTNTVDGQQYYYYTTIRKGTDAFWLITFSSFASEKDTYSKLFAKWANTIVVE